MKYLWEVDYLMDDQRGAMFVEYIQHLETLKLRGLLVPEMVVERGVSAGTFGIARAHTDTFIDMLTLKLEEILFHINRYIVPDLVLYNFGPEAPPCTIDTLVKIGERKDLLQDLLIEIMKAESRTGAIDTGRLIDIMAILQQLGIQSSGRRDLPDLEKIRQIQQEKASMKQEQGQQEPGKKKGSPKAGTTRQDTEDVNRVGGRKVDESNKARKTGGSQRI